jgi:hypothetical protein
MAVVGRLMRKGILIAVAVALLAPAQAARAADPGRWIETDIHQIPFEYFQGMTSDPQRNLYFDGFFAGLYRTTPLLQETGRNPFVIDPVVYSQRERYNHIGDITWDAAEGGRILLPLECFLPGIGNYCGRGAIGVADPQTLQWRYYVNLDPADIPKAMWAEVSPDGSLIWTSSGSDLLAYRTDEISPANAAPDGPLIRPVRRLVGAVPPSGITGATFYGGRLFLAGQDGGLRPPFQVWSVDLHTGERQLEIERTISGESEGLDIVDALGGVLHWMIQPVTPRPPATYPYSVVLSFIPANSPPDCSQVRADPSSLWPPNHKLRAVSLGGATDPDGDPVSIAVSGVAHDEDGAGGAPDHATGARPDQVLLRAERDGGGDGRTYTVEFEALDQQGGRCSGAVTVTVPHDARGGR